MLSVSPARAQTSEQVHEVVQFYADEDHFSGNVVVFHEGRVICNESRGLANQVWSIPNAPNTRFAIGSVTKQFTAAAILLLQEQGRLKTSDPIALYYKQAPTAWKEITIRELLLHNSGIPEELFAVGSAGFERGSHSPEEVVQAAAKRPLAATPGTRTAYNNVEYVLLGLIIERVSGEDYASFLKKHVFEPLNMPDTGVGWLPRVIPRRASGYTAVGSDAQEAEAFTGTALGGAGEMYSTGADLARWLIALHGGSLLKPESLAEMTTADTDGFGYGLSVSTQYGLQDIGHAGDVPGFHVSTEYFPARKTGIIVLTNVASGRGTPGTYAIANDLMSLVSDSKAIVRSTGREVPLTSFLQQAYAGRYQDATGEQIEISRLGDHLKLVPRLPGKSPSTLRAESPNRFYFAEWDGEVQFYRNNGGTLQMIIFAYPNETATVWSKIPDGDK
ncbi:serine hydrolase domain-containing protein [Terriglobus sp.]|uniref:serine hydrolase domain-containing protein n=1 Tax=Terriglobus sp. TaxID=1889013 RepID=UPI003AFFABDF